MFHDSRTKSLVRFASFCDADLCTTIMIVYHHGHLHDAQDAGSGISGLLRTFPFRSPCVPFAEHRCLLEPVHAGLHAARGVSSVQEVGDLAVLQRLGATRPHRVCQPCPPRWSDRSTYTHMRFLNGRHQTVGCFHSFGESLFWKIVPKNDAWYLEN